MKTLWNAIIVLSIANLVALLGFTGWLLAADRLDVDRARSIRQMLAVSIKQQKAEAERLAREAESARVKAEEEARARRAPLTAAEQLAARIEATELDRQRMERLRREVEDLQRSLARERADLDSRQGQLTQDQRAFEAQVKAMADASRDEQFQKALGVLEGLKPAAAKSVLAQMMIGAGAIPAFAADGAQSVLGANQTDAIEPQGRSAAGGGAVSPSVVELLNAMDDRARSKIMAEFVKDDPAMATQLLEGMRLRGQFAPAGAEPSK